MLDDAAALQRWEDDGGAVELLTDIPSTDSASTHPSIDKQGGSNEQ